MVVLRAVLLAVGLTAYRPMTLVSILEGQGGGFGTEGNKPSLTE